MNPFDFGNDLSQHKKDLIRSGSAQISDYNSFMVNRIFSQFPDTIYYANALNRYPEMEDIQNHDFYLFGVPSRKRFAKWAKKQKTEEIESIARWFDCSMKEAKTYISIMDPADVQEICDQINS